MMKQIHPSGNEIIIVASYYVCTYINYVNEKRERERKQINEDAEK